MEYSFDTSAILNTWRRHYPPDLFPTLWEKLESLIDSGIAVATEEVLEELRRKDDEIYNWATRHSDMFIPIDEMIQYRVLGVMNEFPRLVDNQTNRSGADPFVVALAQLHDLTVVTYEERTHSARRPKIPDVCDSLNLRCITVVDLVREQGWAI